MTLFAQCATIVSPTRYPVQITSEPVGAEITITDLKGNTVFSGNTPAKVRLHARGGFFKAGKYDIHFSLEDHEVATEHIEFKLNNWYFGNILFGGLIGLLIVDPATGAMWTLPRNQRNIMVDLETPADSNDVGLRILNLDRIPVNMRPALVRVQ